MILFNWAYPRECGGTIDVAGDVSPESGLSPRVRGNRLAAEGDALRAGPIPASAGEPVPRASFHPQARAYPRECGGTFPNLFIDQVGMGLSPRVRGNHFGLNNEFDRMGPIPASAGEPWQ